MVDNTRWWALAAVTVSVLAAGLGGTVVVVALPVLARELHATQSDLVWFQTIYLLVMAVAVLPIGLVGDWIGRKRVTVVSLLVFGTASTVCAFATSVEQFMIGRVLQGLSAAGITVMAMSALIVMFDDDERPKAVGIYQAANFVALPLGPILGGWMLSKFWWGWVFLINVPVVLIAIVACCLIVPESRADERPGLDPAGTLASVVGLTVFVYGLIRAGDDGVTPVVALALIGGVCTLSWFVYWERRLGRRPNGRPLISPSLLTSRTFMGGALLAGLAGMAMIGVLLTMPQYFEGVQGEDVLTSGMRLLPLIVGMVVGSASAGPVAQRMGARSTVTVGFLALAAGLAWGVTTGPGSSSTYIGGWMTLVGLGTGLTMSAATAVALSGLTKERSGTESAVVQALNKTSGPLGTAVMGSVVVAVYHARLDVSGLSESAAAAARSSLFDALAIADEIGAPELADAAGTAFVDGLRVALMVSATIAVVGAIGARILLPSRRQQNAMTDNR